MDPRENLTLQISVENRSKQQTLTIQHMLALAQPSMEVVEC